MGKVTLPSRAMAKAVSDQWAVSGAVAKGKVGLPNRAVAKAVADQPRKVAMVAVMVVSSLGMIDFLIRKFIFPNVGKNP